MLINILAAPAAEQTSKGFDPMLLIMLLAFAFLIFTMFRGRKKAAKAQAQLRSSLAVGSEVMTQFGLFGTVRSIDTENNKVVLEVSPGNTVTVHSQAVAKVTVQEPSVTAPNDASSLTIEKSPELSEPTVGETPEETLRRLDGDNGSKA